MPAVSAVAMTKAAANEARRDMEHPLKVKGQRSRVKGKTLGQTWEVQASYQSQHVYFCCQRFGTLHAPPLFMEELSWPRDFSCLSRYSSPRRFSRLRWLRIGHPRRFGRDRHRRPPY